MAMTGIKTSTGFCWQVDEEAANDMELLESLIAIDKGDATALPAVIRQLLGDNGKRALYDHVRKENGRVPADEVGVQVGEILEQLKTKKN